MSSERDADYVTTDPSEDASMDVYRSDADAPVSPPRAPEAIPPAADQAVLLQQAMALLQQSQLPPELQESARRLQAQLLPVLPPLALPPAERPPAETGAPAPPLAETGALAPPPAAAHASIAGSSSPAAASTSAPARKKRGQTSANDVWGMVGTPGFQPLELTWDHLSQANGPPDAMRKLKRLLTSMVRMSSMLPINHKDWRGMPRENIDRAFGAVQVCFLFTGLNFLYMLLI
jgi:hypothetical protein